MNHLVPCPSCARHVRQSEAACPFCSVELAFADLSPPALPRTRLGRAATFAFGASLVGASLVACGGDSETGKPGSGGANSMSGAGGAAGTMTGAGTGGSVNAGGAVNAGGTVNAGGAGGVNSAGTFNGLGGNIAQPYGVPPFGGFAPAYGLPPGGNAGTSGGEANAGTAGSGGPTPVYGAPPRE